jgi:hypothetical protein
MKRSDRASDCCKDIRTDRRRLWNNGIKKTNAVLQRPDDQLRDRTAADDFALSVVAAAVVIVGLPCERDAEVPVRDDVRPAFVVTVAQPDERSERRAVFGFLPVTLSGRARSAHREPLERRRARDEAIDGGGVPGIERDRE